MIADCSVDLNAAEGREGGKMQKIGISAVLFFILISVGSPVQAKEAVFTLSGNFPPAGANIPVFAAGGLTAPSLRGPSAEIFVSTLAHEEKMNRKVGGGALLGTGLLFIGIGVSTDRHESHVADFFYLTGAVSAGVGVYLLAVPGYAESEYQRILKIEDPLEREQVSYSVLTHIANKAKVERLSRAVSSAALCLYYLSGKPDYYSSSYYYYNVFLLGGTSVYSFLVESPAERMLKDYRERQKAMNGSLAIVPGLDGSISAVYSLAF